MAEIILDFGSANTCKNDISEVKRMIDAIVNIDTKKHNIIFKWQLFKTAGNNIPLQVDVFDYAYNYAKEKGYKTTASVFDKESLEILLTYDTPFIKIACRKDLYNLIYEIPRNQKIYVSYDLNLSDPRSIYSPFNNLTYVDEMIGCVPKYPAEINDYRKKGYFYSNCISDHTTNLDLFNAVRFRIFEMHYALEGQTGLDVECGICKTPEILRSIL